MARQGTFLDRRRCLVGGIAIAVVADGIWQEDPRHEHRSWVRFSACSAPNARRSAIHGFLGDAMFRAFGLDT
jgi:hypothetical protein